MPTFLRWQMMPGVKHVALDPQRHGGKHDVWTNADGSFREYGPRHAEINERLARAVLKRAKERQ